MEHATDWIRLWRQLAEVQAGRWQAKNRTRAGREADAWQNRARSYDAGMKRRWTQPDSSRAFLVGHLQAHPGSTVLDIGAGTGAWSILLARYARQVTAVEPSPAMAEVMAENLAADGITNVQILRGTWPDVEVGPHDVSLCAHAMYGAADLPGFVGRMMATTQRTCFMVLRAPALDSPMAEAALHIWGQPYDSPNFQVAYNALLQMGLFPNVLMEDSGYWEPWTHASMEEALHDVKRRFGLEEASEHDEFLSALLRRYLTLRNGQYVWPPGVRSALVYWNVESGM